MSRIHKQVRDVVMDEDQYWVSHVISKPEYTPWAHTIKIDLGPWHAAKPCDHITQWCQDNLGPHNRLWRAYRSDYGATLVVQFRDAQYATQFALTWSHT